MIRAVIDTNVLVSGMLSSAGNEALVLLAVNQCMLRPCLSAEIIEEYREVLLRPRFGFSEEDVAALLAMLQSRGALIAPVVAPPVSPDPGDDKFIACAMAAKADFLVTGNKKHFPESEFKGTKVVGSAELLEFITLEP